MNASDGFGFADALGPAKLIHVYEPSVGLKAILVVDNRLCRHFLRNLLGLPSHPKEQKMGDE